MFNVLKGYTNIEDSKSAAEEVLSKIQQDNVSFVIYFASSKYDFEVISKSIKEGFPNCDVIGCTTNGEVGTGGINEGNLIAISIEADDFETSIAVMKKITKRSILGKKDIKKAAEKLGLDFENPDVVNQGFAISLIEAMAASEEKVMSVLKTVFNDEKFPLIGGSAGDSNFKQTYVSYNGEVFTDAAVIAFVKTGKKIFTYKENIYVPTEKEFKATKVDMEKRIVFEFDNKPAVDYYAEALGIKSEELTPEYFSTNPLGRVYGDSIWITSPMDILEDNSIKFYAQLMEGSTVRLLKPIDAVTEAKKTAEAVNENLPSNKLVLVFNCLLRYMQFVKEDSCVKIHEQLSNVNGELFGFTTLGEQYYSEQINQTLVLIAIGE